MDFTDLSTNDLFKNRQNVQTFSVQNRVCRYCTLRNYINNVSNKWEKYSLGLKFYTEPPLESI